MVKLTLVRDVSLEECRWLERPMMAGDEVWEFTGHTYGCIGLGGIAVTDDPDIGPFYELPCAALQSKEAGE